MKFLVSLEEAIAEFTEAIRQAGLVPPRNIIPDGKLRRFSSSGRPGDDAGWYVFHGYALVPHGHYGDWRQAISRAWRASPGRRLTPEELEQVRAETERSAKETAAARAELAERAAVRARMIWREAAPLGADHGYLKRKGVLPVETLRELPVARLKELLGYLPQGRGQPLAGRVIIVPVKVGEQLGTLEFIDESGTKSALYGGRKEGGYWATGPLPPAGRVFLAEGVSTALSLQMALETPVAAALSVNNFTAAGRALLEGSPERELVLMADLGADGHPPVPAVEAQVRLMAPLLFPASQWPEKTDFNDLHQSAGLEALRKALRDGLARLSRMDAGQSCPGPGQAGARQETEDRLSPPCQPWRRPDTSGHVR